ALLEQALRDPDRERRLADDDRDDRPLAVERREAALAQARPARRRDRVQPLAPPPRAFPSVLVITSTSPSTPKCSATPRPVSPITPVPCESSTTTTASCSRPSSTMS